MADPSTSGSLQDEILRILRAHANGDSDRILQELGPLLQKAEARSKDLAKSEERYRAIVVEATLRDITDRVVSDRLKKNYMKSLEEAVVERTPEIRETQRAATLAIATFAESIDDDAGAPPQRIRHYCKILADELRAD